MKVCSILVGVSLALAAALAHAGNSNGHVTTLTAYGNVVIFKVENHLSVPACDSDNSYVIDASSVGGKTMYANLLTAVASDIPVFVFASSNTCPTWWPNSETPTSVTINR